MSRNYKIVLFYAVALLAAIDIYTVSQRLFNAAPDPIDWMKLGFAAAIQIFVVAGTASYLSYLSRAKATSAVSNFVLNGFRLKFMPVLVLGLVAGLSVNMLYNGVNCGSHPLPSARGMSICPK